MTIDLHGYHPSQIVWNGVLAKVIQQAWEMGESELCLIHGHGHNRGISPGFVNTNTGFFGLEIRRALRHDKNLHQWIKHTTLSCEDPGATCVALKKNPGPSRMEFDSSIFPERVRWRDSKRRRPCPSWTDPSGEEKAHIYANVWSAAGLEVG